MKVQEIHRSGTAPKNTRELESVFERGFPIKTLEVNEEDQQIIEDFYSGSFIREIEMLVDWNLKKTRRWS